MLKYFLFEVHAAIIAINEAIDQQLAPETYAALQNPSAMLVNLELGTPEEYQDLLFRAKDVKAENARNKVVFFYCTLHGSDEENVQKNAFHSITY